MQVLQNLFKQFQQEFDAMAWLTTIFTNSLKIIFTLILLYLFKRLAIQLIESYFLGKRSQRFRFAKTARNHTLNRLLKNLIQYLYYFFLSYSILSILGVPIATLLAGAGIFSLAIGLGAKDLVSDIVQGFFIILEHQFDVGDAVEINGYEGTVYSIGLRNTVIRDYNGVHHFIPNGSIGQMTNSSLDHVRMNIDLYVYADQNIDQLEMTLKKIAESMERDEKILIKEPEFLGLLRDRQGRLIYRTRIWVASIDYFLTCQADYYKAFIQGLTEAEVAIPRLNQEIVLKELSSHQEIHPQSSDDLFE